MLSYQALTTVLFWLYLSIGNSSENTGFDRYYPPQPPNASEVPSTLIGNSNSWNPIQSRLLFDVSTFYRTQTFRPDNNDQDEPPQLIPDDQDVHVPLSTESSPEQITTHNHPMEVPISPSASPTPIPTNPPSQTPTTSPRTSLPPKISKPTMTPTSSPTTIPTQPIIHVTSSSEQSAITRKGVRRRRSKTQQSSTRNLIKSQRDRGESQMIKTTPKQPDNNTRSNATQHQMDSTNTPRQQHIILIYHAHEIMDYKEKIKKKEKFGDYLIKNMQDPKNGLLIITDRVVNFAKIKSFPFPLKINGKYERIQSCGHVWIDMLLTSAAFLTELVAKDFTGVTINRFVICLEKMIDKMWNEPDPEWKQTLHRIVTSLKSRYKARSKQGDPNWMPFLNDIGNTQSKKKRVIPHKDLSAVHMLFDLIHVTCNILMKDIHQKCVALAAKHHLGPQQFWSTMWSVLGNQSYVDITMEYARQIYLDNQNVIVNKKKLRWSSKRILKIIFTLITGLGQLTTVDLIANWMAVPELKQTDIVIYWDQNVEASLMSF